MQPHRGTLILILGILSLFCCGIILGPIAFFLGNADLRAMREGRMDPSGEGLTNAGRILGVIGAVIALILIILQLSGVITFGPSVQQLGK
jgi:hypothetical protein